MRSRSTSPEVSVSSVRLSETVRTAMLTGRNGGLESLADMLGDLHRVLLAVVAGPTAGRQRIERGRGLPQTIPIDPQIGEDVLDERAGLPGWDRLDEHQGVVGRLRVALPSLEIARPAVPGRGQAEQVAGDVVVGEEHLEISLPERDVRFGAAQPRAGVAE